MKQRDRAPAVIRDTAPSPAPSGRPEVGAPAGGTGNSPGFVVPQVDLGPAVFAAGVAAAGPPPAPAAGWPTAAKVAVGLGTAAGLAILFLFALLAVVLVYVARAGQPPLSVGASVVAPQTAAVGKSCELRVTIANRRASPVQVANLSFSADLLKIVEILDVQPSTGRDEVAAVDGLRSAYRVERMVAPGSSLTLTVRLKPRRPGPVSASVTVSVAGGQVVRLVRFTALAVPAKATVTARGAEITQATRREP